MKFFDWLFNEGQYAYRETDNDYVTDTKKFIRVPKWTHSGWAGKDIYCPACGDVTHVYNFSWSALACSKCKAVTDKYDWLLPVTRGKKK